MNKNTDTITYKLGTKIRIERIKRGLSQEELAEKAGIAINSVGGIERGEQSPTVETVDLIAKALDMEISKLFIFTF